MPDQIHRLLGCFALVFPGLTENEIKESSAEATGAWDSLSGVTLIAVVEEEFDIDIKPDAFSNLNSFDAFNGYLQKMNVTKEVSS
jgi:acyl carrier protein